MEGQQVATELLTAAGANYYMDVSLNTDRMLAYFDTSAHDDQTLREIHGKIPAPEYLDWGLARGIFVRDRYGVPNVMTCYSGYWPVDATHNLILKFNFPFGGCLHQLEGASLKG